MIYTAEITAWNSTLAAEETHYFSTASLVTGAADTPAHTAFQPRIIQPALLREQMFTNLADLAHSQLSYGELIIANPDGALDTLYRQPIAGRTLIIRAGEPGTDYPGDWTTVFRGTVGSVSAGLSQLSFRVRSAQAMLETPLQPNLYAGDNALPAGLEGDSTLRETRKPLCYGQVFNVSPPCVNTSRLIYQVNDGAVASVDAVYDQGLALTAGTAYTDQTDMETNAPSAGYYRAWLAGGYVRLGSTPTGALTADVTQGAVAADRTAAQLLKALALQAGVASGDINGDDVAALDLLTSAVLGLWIADDTTALAAMDQIAGSVGAWYGFDADGEFRMAYFLAPASPETSVATLTVDEITQLEVTTGANEEPPAWSIIVNFARNYTVQTNDLAGAVTAERRAWLAQEWRIREITMSGTRTLFPLAPMLTINTALVDETAAAFEALRRFILMGTLRDRIKVVVRVRADLIEAIRLGTMVTVTVPRLGYDDGCYRRVVGIETDLRRHRIELDLWG